MLLSTISDIQGRVEMSIVHEIIEEVTLSWIHSMCGGGVNWYMCAHKKVGD